MTLLESNQPSAALEYIAVVDPETLFDIDEITESRACFDCGAYRRGTSNRQSDYRSALTHRELFPREGRLAIMDPSVLQTSPIDSVVPFLTGGVVAAVAALSGHWFRSHVP